MVFHTQHLLYLHRQENSTAEDISIWNRLMVFCDEPIGAPLRSSLGYLRVRGATASKPTHKRNHLASYFLHKRMFLLSQQQK